MTYDLDVVVIGAGVIGLAIARELQQRGRKTVLIERNTQIGTEISARSSEVIHSGIYYPPNSLKAMMCVRGKALTYDYCLSHGIPHKKLGKIIVAVDENEIGQLHSYLDNAHQNGVDDLEWVSALDLASLEPAVSACAGLYSPGTGILDSHAFMKSLLHDFEISGGLLVRATEVLSGIISGTHARIMISDAFTSEMTAECVINAAGLYATTLARNVEGLDHSVIPVTHYAIGHYFTFTGRSPFNRLVYPVASGGGLGVHVTMDMSGQVRFGPDISWRSSIDYNFEHGRLDAFHAAIKRYFPAISKSDLQPGYTGIRPKISGPGEAPEDFRIDITDRNGSVRWVNLFGIESPGLTSALAIANHVGDCLGQ